MSSEKIWAYSNTGAKMHAFINGKAMCRAIYRNAEVIERSGVSLEDAFGVCKSCEKKFTAMIDRAEASMMPSTGEGDYLPPAQEESPTVDLPVSDTMHMELVFAFNRYQSSCGVVAFCPSRTEDALIRRGLITYCNQDDHFPVVTVKGWNYLAAKDFQRHAEDPGRLTMDEAVREAYADVQEEVPVKTVEWTSKNAWGAIGLTHRASETIGDDKYTFTVKQPRKGQWVTHGWKNGAFFLYRDGGSASTLAEMKELVAQHVGELRIAAKGEGK